MAFTLKKHTGTQAEATRLNDVNDNWEAIEDAIDTLQTNASLRHPNPWMLSLESVANKKTQLYKYADASNDFGTVLIDRKEDKSYTSLTLHNGKLTLTKKTADGTTTSVVVAQL